MNQKVYGGVSVVVTKQNYSMEKSTRVRRLRRHAQPGKHGALVRQLVFVIIQVHYQSTDLASEDKLLKTVNVIVV